MAPETTECLVLRRYLGQYCAEFGRFTQYYLSRATIIQPASVLRPINAFGKSKQIREV
jgi:hypothetical protein